MVYIRSRKFCCCLPVRFGVFVMAVLSLGLGGLASFGGWKEVMKAKQNNLSKRDEITLYVQTVMYTLLAVISLFGLVGTFIKRRSFVSLYSSLVAFHLGFHIVTGAFTLYSLYHKDGERDVQNCINGATNPINGEAGEKLTKEVCEKGFVVLRTIAVVIYVIVVLVELYGCIIVSNYVEQLEEEEAAKLPKGSTTAFNNASITNPLPQTTYNSYSGSTNYPFRGYDNTSAPGV
jgi:hypothetical protein